MLSEYQMRVYQYPNGDSFDWVVEYPDLPGCIGTGDTIEDAIEDAKISKDLWIEAANGIDKEIPLPSDSFSIEYSGKFNIRIPKSLHRELVLRAEEEGVSLNALCSSILARGVYRCSQENTYVRTAKTSVKTHSNNSDDGDWLSETQPSIINYSDYLKSSCF